MTIRTLPEPIVMTLKRMYLANIDYHHINFFFDFTAKEIRSIVASDKIVNILVPGHRGRPIEIYDTPSCADRLKVLKLYYEGYDIIEIADTLKSDVSFKMDINSICNFFSEQQPSTYFGIGTCLHCSQTYIHVADDPKICCECNHRLNKKDKNDVSSRSLIIATKPVTPAGRAPAESKRFSHVYHSIMRDRLIKNTVDIHQINEAKKNIGVLLDIASAIHKQNQTSDEHYRLMRLYLPAIRELKNSVKSIFNTAPQVKGTILKSKNSRQSISIN